MIRSITTPLRSKRIHIGMDEAHGVGEGRYRHIFGYKEGTQVVRCPCSCCDAVSHDGAEMRVLHFGWPWQFTDHLKRVNAICKKVGIEPMIWSDSAPFVPLLMWLSSALQCVS